MDFKVRSAGGNMFMVYPLTEPAKAWVDEKVHVEDWQWLGEGFSVDQHYIEMLIQWMQDDGFEVT